MTLIYKIETKERWEKAKQNGLYEGSKHDQRDGYIHFSSKETLEGTLDKHFKGKTNLLLIAVNAKDLGQALKWEASRGGALFPHLYAPLPTTHILWEKPLQQSENGTHILPIDLQ